MKIKEQFNENEALENAEYDRDIRIAEQKRFDKSLTSRFTLDPEPREARLQDMHIYQLGQLEY
jgi:hypothetical protein